MLILEREDRGEHDEWGCCSLIKQYQLCLKKVALHIFINCAMHVFSDNHALNSEIQYLKAIPINRGYNSSIIDVILFKLKHGLCSCSSQLSSLSRISIF